MKHLVLGSAGQIGTHLCKYLEKQNEEVIKFDIKTNKFNDLRYTQSSDWNRLNLQEAFENCDFVHFLAFDVGGAKYLEKYQHTHKFISNNMKIMTNVFDMLKSYNKPFIFYSSQMVYNMGSSYGHLKLLGEKITKDLNGIILRLWNVYGYEEEEEKAHVITDFIKMAKKGEIKMLTSGSEKRQFLNAMDCSRAILMVVQQYEKYKGKEFDLTSNTWVSIIEIAKIIRGLIPCKVNPGRDGNTIYEKYHPTYHKLVPGFKPEISLEDGIKQIIKEYDARN